MVELEIHEVALVAGGIEIVQADPPGFWEGLARDITGWLAGDRPTSLPVVGSSGIRG